MGKFVITKRKDDQIQFVLRAPNGQTILVSEAYTTKAACENGIDSVKKNALKEEMFERKVAVNKQPYFNLKATNGQVIGTSEMYDSEEARDNGIKSVMTNAPTATIEDLTAAK